MSRPRRGPFCRLISALAVGIGGSTKAFSDSAASVARGPRASAKIFGAIKARIKKVKLLNILPCFVQRRSRDPVGNVESMDAK